MVGGAKRESSVGLGVSGGGGGSARSGREVVCSCMFHQCLRGFKRAFPRSLTPLFRRYGGYPSEHWSWESGLADTCP